jgi:hypothetical protein
MMIWLKSLAANALQRVTSWKPEEEISKLASGDIMGLEPWDVDNIALRKAYKEMLNDSTVKAAFLTMLFELCQLNIKVATTSEEQKDKDVAAFVDYCLHACKGGLANGVLMKIVKPAMQYTFSISEIVYAPITTGKWKNKVGIKFLKSKDTSADAWSFEVDEFKNVTAIIQNYEGTQRAFGPSKFIRYAFMAEFDNPFGVSHLRAAYRAWWVKKTVLRAWAYYNETSGAVPVGTYQGDAQRAALETQLKKFAGRRWLAIPDSVKLEIKDFTSNVAQNGYRAACDYQDKQIFLSIRGAFLQALEGDRTGARSMGEVHESTADLFVWYLSQEVADALNDQLVPQLVAMNFGEDVDVPHVTLESPVEEDLKISAEVDTYLSKMGLPLSKQEMYDKYGRTAPRDDEDALVAPAPASPFGAGLRGELPEQPEAEFASPSWAETWLAEYNAALGEFDEGKHPREKDWKFADAGGGNGGGDGIQASVAKPAELTPKQIQDKKWEELSARTIGIPKAKK